MACRAAGLRPGPRPGPRGAARRRDRRARRCRRRASAGCADAVSDAIPLGSLSGGTDLCTGFLGPSPLVPVWAGEISCRMLGARVEAFDPDGRSLVGEQGELVITAPMPSMPVGLWGDDDGSRMRAAYFEPWPGVWRHGDWLTITDRGSCVITGRSDATLNRGGVRLGTAEFYAVVEALPEVADSLVVHLEDAGGGPGELLLFVVLRDGAALDDGLRAADRARAPRRALAAPRPGRDPRGARHPAHAVGQEARGPGQADPARACRRTPPPRRTPSPTRARSSRSRRSPPPDPPTVWLTAPVAFAGPGAARACLLLSGIGGLAVGVLTSLGSGRCHADRGRVARELRGCVVRLRRSCSPSPIGGRGSASCSARSRCSRCSRATTWRRSPGAGPCRRRRRVLGGRRRSSSGPCSGVGAAGRAARIRDTWPRGRRAARGDPDRRGRSTG